MRAPADIGFTSLGVAGGADPTSGICQRPVEIGRVAAQILDLTLRNYGDTPAAVPIFNVINGEWHEGDSVRPPPQQKRPPEQTDGLFK